MFGSYLKLALKVLARRKFFTFVSLFGVSVTLVVLMVATAVLDQAVGAQPPEIHADRTLGLYQLSMRGPGRTSDSEPSYGFLDRYLRTLPDVERVTVFSTTSRTATYRDGERVELYLKRTDGDFWHVYGFDFLEGGPFTAEDDASVAPVAVINASIRRRLWGREPALGRRLELGGRGFRVVGVVSDVSFLSQDPFADVWVPISTLGPDVHQQRALLGNFNGVVLARHPRDFPAVRRAFQASLGSVELTEPFDELRGFLDTRFEFAARTLFSDHLKIEAGAWRLRLAIVLAMLLFMLLPSLNLINLNVSRILERASEIGVRKAFGASSRTLVGQFVVENVLLTLIGAGIAFGVSSGVLALLTRAAIVPYGDFHLNFRVFFWGLVIALVFGLVSGVYPAWKMSRLHPVAALRRRSL